MAKKTDPDAATAPSEEERVDEAAAVEDQQEEIAASEAKREREAERASETKAAKDSELPPTQVTRKGETAYSTQRLIDDAQDFLGVPSHVVVGALAESDKEYHTIADTKRAIDAWMKKEAN